MKQGKRPNRSQKALLSANNLNPTNWLIVKNQDHQLLVIHRNTKQLKTLEI